MLSIVGKNISKSNHLQTNLIFILVDLSGVFLVLAAVISLGGRGLLLEKFKKAKKQEEEEEEESQSGIQITK